MKRGFTLIELMLAILLGAMVVFMIAGSLRAAIHAWESVERHSAQNYNRRTVLDLMKRQTSSLFYAEDAREMNNQTTQRRPNQPNPKNRKPETRNQRPTPGQKDAFSLPRGMNFFVGAAQQIEFISTVAFLSDFPGQVSVKYYVVQEVEDEESESKPLIGETAPPPPEMILSEDGEEAEVEELEGNLYLIMQEINLFKSQTRADDIQAPPGEEAPLEPGEEEFEEEIGYDDEIPLEDILEEDPSVATQVRLLGPLRKFSIRYRIPNKRDVNEEDEEEDWQTSWNVSGENGQYPSAIEFVLFYEIPGVTDDIETEELDGIRMVIPVYSSNNLNQRGSNHGAFFEE